MFSLKDLHHFDSIILQCHDNPDIDAIASAFALSCYFRNQQIDTQIIYAGHNIIKKPNILEFIQELDIKVKFIGKNDKYINSVSKNALVLLLIVDGQFGASNMSRVEHDEIYVIDHHIKEKNLAKRNLIKPYLGSCATVVWELLKQESFSFEENMDVATALYYGLYTDTNSFAEIHHPIDKDMLESLPYNDKLIKKLRGNNLSKEEMIIAGNALKTASFDESKGFAIFEAEACDPNILGFINDLLLQVSGIDVCVGFCQSENHRIKLSIRSSTHEVMANELAAYLTSGYGSGGGNKGKAGGSIGRPLQDISAKEYIATKMNEYFTSYDKITAGKDVVITDGMGKFRKKNIPLGYVTLADIYAIGTEVIVRTMEGDAVFKVAADTYLIIGVQGEVYPIDKEKFQKTYSVVDDKFSLPVIYENEDSFFFPTIKDKLFEKSMNILPYAKACLHKGETFIYAKDITKNTKVFTKWYTEGYMVGRKGDYLAVRCDDSDDIYVIENSIFALMYE